MNLGTLKIKYFMPKLLESYNIEDSSFLILQHASLLDIKLCFLYQVLGLLYTTVEKSTGHEF